MKVVFCIYGYSPDVERLQPWVTVYEVALVLLAAGWEVHLITDVDQRPTVAAMKHHYVRTMRPSNAHEVRAVLDEIEPDRVVVLTTPLNLLGSGWYKFVRCKLIAFLSYPFYTWQELIRALPHLGYQDIVTYGRHVLVPKFLWSRTLVKYYSAVIAQSVRTATRVADAAGPTVYAHGLHAGLDLDIWKPADSASIVRSAAIRFLFVGSAKAVRGFNVLLDAFGQLTDCDVELRVLARGSGPDEVDRIGGMIKRRLGGMSARVAVMGGWMEREHYRAEVRVADVVVLPFVLVPSELPVSVLECIACGTPVIATDIDGLPDAVGDAGMIVRSASVKALTAAMRDVAMHPALLAGLRKNCIEARKGMLSWSEVGQEWQRVLSL